MGSFWEKPWDRGLFNGQTNHGVHDRKSLTESRRAEIVSFSEYPRALSLRPSRSLVKEAEN